MKQLGNGDTLFSLATPAPNALAPYRRPRGPEVIDAEYRDVKREPKMSAECRAAARAHGTGVGGHLLHEARRQLGQAVRGIDGDADSRHANGRVQSLRQGRADCAPEHVGCGGDRPNACSRDGRTTTTAYCGRCSDYRIAVGVRCTRCGRRIWELVAQDCSDGYVAPRRCRRPRKTAKRVMKEIMQGVASVRWRRASSKVQGSKVQRLAVAKRAVA